MATQPPHVSTTALDGRWLRESTLHDQRVSSEGKLGAWYQLAIRALPLVILSAGVLVRCIQLFSDRSLFLDEAFVATNIVKRSYAELLQPLEFDQRAPAGWLWCVKLASSVFGESDRALRAIPFLSGILAIGVFPFLARRYVGASAYLPALLFFVLSPPQIFYSSDLKQYSTDTLMAIVVLLTFAPIPSVANPWRLACLRGLIGAAALWFSFPVVFVLAGVALVHGLVILANRDWAEIPRWLMIGALWAIGFGSIWWLQLRHFEAEPGWKALWNDAFMPFPPHRVNDLRWYYEKFFDLLTTPVGLRFGGLAALAFLLGIRSMWHDSKMRLALLLAPVVLILAASALRVYPVAGRVILFLGPVLALIIAQGVGSLFQQDHPTVRWLALVMVIILGMTPAGNAAHTLITGKKYSNPLFMPYHFEESKPVMKYLRDHWQPGDIVYLYDMSYVAFEHYAPRFGFKKEDYHQGIWAGLCNPTWDEIRVDLEKLKGRKRAWVFMTHVWTHNGVDERKLVKYFLDHMGTRVDKYELLGANDASVYLYDLSSQND